MDMQHSRFIRLIGLALLVMSIAVGTAQATTPQGLKADGLRLQAMADRYQWLQGVKADGMRWQAAADYYATHTSRLAPATGRGFDWGDAGIGAGVGAATFLGLLLLGIAARRGRQQKLAV